ncbi:MAG: DNA repair and recombination protein RadB [Methanomassiliicoccales archaeon]|nr:DNA repair and recombination protein RadB [Methanomassiliicoccales archaeon]
MEKVPFDCASIDAVLGGGVEPACITLFYGEAGTGKTNLCLVLSRNIARQGRKVVYVDTEGVSLERLDQISGSDSESVIKNILLSEVHSFDEQEKMVDRAIKLAEGNPEVGMIVVDSMTMYYRLTSREEERSERKSIANQTVKLLGVARKMAIPILATSQVYTDIDKGTFEALGGHALHHNAKTLLKVEKISPGKRRIVVMKHRHIAEGKVANFSITSDGIACQG